MKPENDDDKIMMIFVDIFTSANCLLITAPCVAEANSHCNNTTTSYPVILMFCQSTFMVGIYVYVLETCQRECNFGITCILWNHCKEIFVTSSFHGFKSCDKFSFLKQSTNLHIVIPASVCSSRGWS